MTAPTLTLTDFLLARIAEDEAAGRKAADDTYGSDRWSCELWVCDEQGSHVAIDPPRVLAECEAKRRIVEQWHATQPPASDADYAVEDELTLTLMFLALPYADHGDYNPDWRP